MVAAQKGHLSVVELLVSVGAQVNSQSNVSSYPIDMYVYRVYVLHSHLMVYHILIHCHGIYGSS